MLAHVVHVALLGKDHGARRAGGSLNGVVGCKERTSKSRDETGSIFVGLDSVPEATVVTTPPGEDTRDMSRGCGSLNGYGMVLAATDGANNNLTTIGDVDHCASLGIGYVGVLFRLDKERTTLKLGRIRKAQLVGGNEILSGLAVAELTIFG